MIAVIATAAGLVGLAVGSFLDVVAFRLPRGLSLAHPPSFCPSCRAPLTWADNVPVVSWLALRGRCRRCGASIPARALAVEAGTGAGFVAVALVLGRSWAIPGACLLVATVIVLAATAAEGSTVPWVAAAAGTGGGALALAVAAAVVGHWGRLGWAGLGAAVGLGVVLAVGLVRHRPGAGARPSMRWADATLTLVPAAALLGWLGAVPSAVGVAAGVIAGALVTAIAQAGASAGTARAVRSAVTLGCAAAVLVALVAAGVTGAA